MAMGGRDAASGPLRVGACLSLSGRYARFGAQAVRALQAWAALDGDAELVIEDDRSDPGMLQALLPKVAAGCDVLLGPYSTQLARVAVKMATGAGWLVWNHGGSGDDVQAACPGHAVSLLAPASRYAERFIRDVLDGTSLELWIGQGKGSFGRQVADGAQKIAGQAGISTRRLGNGDSCPCPSGPWALVSAGTFEDDVQAVNRARRQPSPPRLIFSVAAGVREFAGEVDQPEGIYGAGQWFPGSATRAELGPPEDTFLAAYAMVTDQPADYPGVQAAAAAVVAAHCARQARSTARGQLWAQAAALDTATLFGGFRINPVSGAQVKHETALVRWTYGQLALALAVSPGTSSERAPGPRRKTRRTSLVSVTDAPLLMRPGFAEALRAFCKASSPRSDRLGEPLDEVECRLGDLAPAVVDREGVAPVGDLRDLRDGGVAPLPLVACRSLLGGCGGRACACGWMSSPGRESSPDRA